MPTSKIITVSSKAELQSKISAYARDGFATMHNDGNSVTLSRKKKFNWIVAIICLFIPVIGWIALAMMIAAANRGHEVVELHLA